MWFNVNVIECVRYPCAINAAFFNNKKYEGNAMGANNQRYESSCPCSVVHSDCGCITMSQWYNQVTSWHDCNGILYSIEMSVKLHL